MKGSSRIRIDAALGEHALTGLVRRGASVLATIVERVATGDGGRPDLPAAFAALRGAADRAAGGETAGARVRVALLSPHADARLLKLPPLRAAEAAAIVRRDAGRHFMAMPSPRVVAVDVPRRRHGAPMLAVAASAQLVHEVMAAAAQSGWAMETVAAAHGAWVAAARQAGNDVAAVVAVDGAAAHVIHLTDGTPVTMRRFPADALDEVAGALSAPEADAEQRTAIILADDAFRDGVAHRIAARGWLAAPLRQRAAEAAAHNVARSRLELVTDSAAAARRAREARVAVRLAVAAGLLLLAAAGVELWGAHRQLADVRQERAAVRSQVQPLLALRDSMDLLQERMGAVEAVAVSAPRWTFAIHDLAMMLPPETHVTRLTATGDTLVVEAEGAGAGAALQALRAAPSLTDARLMGTVDRELADGETANERFRIMARLARRSAP